MDHRGGHCRRSMNCFRNAICSIVQSLTVIIAEVPIRNLNCLSQVVQEACQEMSVEQAEAKGTVARYLGGSGKTHRALGLDK